MDKHSVGPEQDTFVHLEMGVEFLIGAERLHAVRVITLIQFCSGWSMFTSHMGA